MGSDQELMSKALFLTVVSEQAMNRTFGIPRINQWPTHNYWAVLSTVKNKISDDQVPELMKAYNVRELSDFPPPE
jgi:hypothetical protein